MQEDSRMYGFLMMIGVGVIAWLFDLRIKAAVLYAISIGMNRVGGILIVLGILLAIWYACSHVCDRLMQAGDAPKQ